jgi:hypothetical protein
MSFPRHEEIYRPMGMAKRLGRPTCGHPSAHRYDEFPAGYSLVGCAPAEPASASPAGAHGAPEASSSTIEIQRTANYLLTACLTRGDNPIYPFCHSERSEESLFLFLGSNRGEIPRFARNEKINYFFHGLFNLQTIQRWEN